MPTLQQPTVPPAVPILSLFAEALRRPLARLSIGRRPGRGTVAERLGSSEKDRLIDDIRQLNATATPQFLARFDLPALREYLDHLSTARARRTRPASITGRSAERVLAQ